MSNHPYPSEQILVRFFSVITIQTDDFELWIHHHLATMPTAILETSPENFFSFGAIVSWKRASKMPFSFSSSVLSFVSHIHPFVTGRGFRFLLQSAEASTIFLILLTITKAFLRPLRKVWWWWLKRYHKTFMLPWSFLKASALLGLSNTL